MKIKYRFSIIFVNIFNILYFVTAYGNVEKVIFTIIHSFLDILEHFLNSSGVKVDLYRNLALIISCFGILLGPTVK